MSRWVPTGGDEQTRNARRVVEAGGAVIIKQSELTGLLLLEEVKKLLTDRGTLVEMGQKHGPWQNRTPPTTLRKLS